MRLEYYEAILERLSKEYGLTLDREHQFVTELLEGPLPLFKLILSEGENEEAGIMIVSYHLEMRPPDTIQWFMRLRNLDPNLHMTASYIKDANGDSHVGEDAEILRMYMIEQDVITAWMASNKDAAEVLGKDLPLPKPSPVKSYNTYRQALIEFQKMQKKKGDISH